MQGAEPVFRFAQISDPHLTDLSGVKLRDLGGKRALGYLSWLRRRRHEHRQEFLDSLRADLIERAPGHTVVTGDLTHISLPQEFRQAGNWLRTLGEPEQVTVVPGNHDAYVRLPWEASLGLWADFMRADGLQAPDRIRFPLLRIRGPVAFIGLNSALPTPPLFATGRVGQAQMERLAECLSSLRGKGLLRVLLIHHPPVPGSEKWRKRLVDAPALCELLERAPVDIVLHGHQHRPGHTLFRLTGREIPVFGIASASAAGLHCAHASTYNEYDVRQRGDGFCVEVKARTWQRDRLAYQEEVLASLSLPRD